MDDARVRAARARYGARPGRKVLVVTDLADLHGPVNGTVELPHRLCWQPKRTFDLDKPPMRRWIYEIVLREAVRPEDLSAFLDRDTLVAIWKDLFLPRGVRRAWEEQHPVLAAATAQAA